MRRQTRTVRVGDRFLGSGHPILIQSMTNTDTADWEATVSQCARLEEAGCEIIRVSVYNEACVKALPKIRGAIHIPLVADIHFSADLAVKSLEAGVDKLRLNPGNIGAADRVRRVADAAKAHHTPIRVGVNSGSLSKDMLRRFGGPTPEALAQSALDEAKILEDAGFSDIVVAVKATNVPAMTEAVLRVAQETDYPLHLGVTEAGTSGYGTVKSAVGLGALLLRGIGDTIRVSLSGDPVLEVEAAREILQAAGARRFFPEVISCPTCGRTHIQVEEIAREVQRAVRGVTKPLTVAVMGCIVNGPGEAREADLGIAGGEEYGLLFRKGQIIKKIPSEGLKDALLDAVKEWVEE